MYRIKYIRLAQHIDFVSWSGDDEMFAHAALALYVIVLIVIFTFQHLRWESDCPWYICVLILIHKNSSSVFIQENDSGFLPIWLSSSIKFDQYIQATIPIVRGSAKLNNLKYGMLFSVLSPHDITQYEVTHHRHVPHSPKFNNCLIFCRMVVVAFCQLSHLQIPPLINMDVFYIYICYYY